MDGEMNFLAIISKITNPRLAEVIEEFDETISFLFDPIEDKTDELSQTYIVMTGH